MKTLIFIMLAGPMLGNLVTCAQIPPIVAPIWNATMRVTDEDGRPIRAADVAIWHYVIPTNGGNEASEKIAGISDDEGLFSASAHSVSVSLSFVAEKAGYYKTTKGYELGPTFQYDLLKWSPHVTLILKKIGHPIPMYAKRLDKGPPVLSQAVGYDLMVGDWVAPYGHGKATDIIFAKEAYRESGKGYDYKVTVSFPNAGDGIQEFQVPESESRSDLRSPHEAPLAGYQNQLIKDRYAHPGQPPKSNYHENANYFLRVRTALDAQGNVKSALYGKIYGEFTHIAHYLNPTPNDRNLEFDPNHNMIQGLLGADRITAP